MQPIPEEIRDVYRWYGAMAGGLDAEQGLGGRLFYAGALNETRTRQVRAANIAGAASLAVSNDGGAMRNAMRAGVVDFVVTTLDEALRILKNEIRKRQAVSVGIQGEQVAVEEEMEERGVAADLVLKDVLPLTVETTWLGVQLPAGNAGFAAQLEAAVMTALPVEDHLNRRWFRLSSRYLGREHRQLRTLCVDEALVERLRPYFSGTGTI